MIEALRRKAGFVHSLCRIAAWLLSIGIALLHVVPAAHRPMTPVGHGLEHVGIFLLLGLASGLGYPRRLRAVLLGLALYCLAVEAIQFAVPGRHPRLSDLLINGASVLIGVALSVVLVRLWAVSIGEGAPASKVEKE